MRVSEKLLVLLHQMSDEQLYEAGKLVSALVAQRHSLRAMEGKELRPGKRGVPWRRADGKPLPNHKKRRKAEGE